MLPSFVDREPALGTEPGDVCLVRGAGRWVCESTRRDRARRTSVGHTAAAVARVRADRRTVSVVAGCCCGGTGAAYPANTQPARRTPPPEPEKPTPAPAPAASVEAPRVLSAVSAPLDPEAEKRINELLRNANRDLNSVDYGSLTRGGE